jgi:hypothetical protein
MVAKRLLEGLDYRLYKIYVWGGLTLLVLYVVLSTLVFETPSLTDSQVFLRLLLPSMLYFAGILLYWWWVFLFKGNRDLMAMRQEHEQGVPGIKAHRSWNTLHQAMAIHGGNVEEYIGNARRANRPILALYGILNLLAVWIYGPIALGTLGIITPDNNAGWVWLAGIFVGIALLFVATPILAGWGAKGASEAYLAPLGLAVTRTPGLEADLIGPIGGGQKLIPDGPAIVEGNRYERLVHIETMDKQSLTVVQARLPAFQAHSTEGKLVPDEGAPEAVVTALRSLRKAKRWRGIVVHAGPEGMAVQRQSKGSNMWLYDLWLAEYLLDEIKVHCGLVLPGSLEHELDLKRCALRPK